MKVKLLYYTENALERIARMAHSTRSKKLEKEWKADLSVEGFINVLLRVKHEGPFEHIIFTFHVSEISRSLTHQLVRHRIASYLQQSSRHVKPRQAGYVYPPTIEEHSSKLTAKYEHAMEDMWDIYEYFIEAGIPIEDARYLLPSGYFTHISITMNCRELRHFFELRCGKYAQWEIREMANKMLKICYEKYPEIFRDLYQRFIKEE